MSRERTLADPPMDGERTFVQGTLSDPKGHWLKYNAKNDEWVRTR